MFPTLAHVCPQHSIMGSPNFCWRRAIRNTLARRVLDPVVPIFKTCRADQNLLFLVPKMSTLCHQLLIPRRVCQKKWRSFFQTISPHCHCCFTQNKKHRSFKVHVLLARLPCLTCQTFLSARTSTVNGAPKYCI